MKLFSFPNWRANLLTAEHGLPPCLLAPNFISPERPSRQELALFGALSALKCWVGERRHHVNALNEDRSCRGKNWLRPHEMYSNRKTLSVKIIGRLECGRTQQEVSEELGIAHSVISRLWQRFRDDGNIFSFLVCFSTFKQALLKIDHVRNCLAGHLVSRNRGVFLPFHGGLLAVFLQLRSRQHSLPLGDCADALKAILVVKALRLMLGRANTEAYCQPVRESSLP
ncbi:hypothetical protein CEXT_380961 [Caerostris extrusa]|uniref:Uncharacterized protein n=1 Tax=Caerostris extrusa TaxID=172846 RepID=A0AAV4NBW6_CAEEX|nr:hypothetical protein CEXT_380961 [Caerostris extrusa]